MNPTSRKCPETSNIGHFGLIWSNSEPGIPPPPKKGFTFNYFLTSKLTSAKIHEKGGNAKQKYVI